MKIVFLVTEDSRVLKCVYAALGSVVFAYFEHVVVVPADNYDSAVKQVKDVAQKSLKFDLAIIEVTLNGEPRGIELAHALQSETPGMPIILVSSDVDEAKKLAEKAYVDVKTFIGKSDNLSQLHVDIANVLRRATTRNTIPV